MRGILLGVLLAAATAQAQLRPARFAGRVLIDTIIKPLAGAEVLFPELGKSTMSDGKGTFAIDSIPPGVYRVQARKIGYALFDAKIQFRDNETVTRALLLPRLTKLDSVVVVGESTLPISFLEHRAVGLGHFVDRNELEKQGNRKLSDIIAMTPGLGIVQGRTNQAWLMSKRYTGTIRSAGAPYKPSNNPQNDCGANAKRDSGEDIYQPTCAELSRGVKVGCYARVYLDKMLVNSGSPAEPVDVNQFISQSIEAVEYFSGPAQTPIEYARLNSTCGVLVIHTRKSK